VPFAGRWYKGSTPHFKISATLNAVDWIADR